MQEAARCLGRATGSLRRRRSLKSPSATSWRKTVNGVMQMQPVDSLAVDANLPVRLAPNGYHVMLEGLMHPLKAGDQFPVTLTFEHAGEITAVVHVQALGAAGPAAPDMSGMHMGH